MSRVNRKMPKLNNSGSTLALTLVAIALISLLASVILAASVNNVVMKQIDNNAKNTFYTAESVVDEIKVGVGKDSINSMAKAYEEVLSNLIITNGTLDYMMDNETANSELQRRFMESMTTKLTGGNVSFSAISDKLEDNTGTTLSNVKTYLEGYINKTDLDNKYATIKSIESITIIKDYNGLKNQIIVNNVVINYKAEKSTDTYFANVTVDLNVEYPNMTVDFSTSKRLKDFKEFALVADGDITLTATTKNVTANVNAGMYAGNNITITSGTSGTAFLNVGAFTDADGNVKLSNIVARNDILIKGSESSATVPGNVAKLSVATANIWCRNISTQKHETSLKKDITAGVEIAISEDSNSYIADDLNITGKNSKINIGGEYYGYSYDGTAVDNNHQMSSAIIINGAGSVLNLGTETVPLKKLVIGGHAYISYKDSSVIDYMTGESLSFTGDQELYLIPPEYIGVGHKKDFSNPMPKETWENLLAEAAVADSGIAVVDLTGFFASTEGLLASTPYEVKFVDGDMAYVYFNFKDRDSAAKYISGVLSGKAPELRTKLDKYTNELLGDDVTTAGSVSIAEGVSMYTAGALLQKNSASVGLSYGGSISVVDFATISMDLQNRHTIITQLLVNLPKTVNGSVYVVSDPEKALEELKEYYVTGNELNSDMDASYNIVDWSMVTANSYNADLPTKLLDGTGYAEALTKVVIDGSYTVPDNITGGIIVATGDVTVNHNFKGLIITQGNIKLAADATITTNDAMIESLMTFEYDFTDGSAKEDIPFKNYFYAYKSSGDDGSEEIKIESLGYDDIVGITNWRKYDDSASATP